MKKYKYLFLILFALFIMIPVGAKAEVIKTFKYNNKNYKIEITTLQSKCKTDINENIIHPNLFNYYGLDEDTNIMFSLVNPLHGAIDDAPMELYLKYTSEDVCEKLSAEEIDNIHNKTEVYYYIDHDKYKIIEEKLFPSGDWDSKELNIELPEIVIELIKNGDIVRIKKVSDEFYYQVYTDRGIIYDLNGKEMFPNLNVNDFIKVGDIYMVIEDETNHIGFYNSENTLIESLGNSYFDLQLTEETLLTKFKGVVNIKDENDYNILNYISITVESEKEPNKNDIKTPNTYDGILVTVLIGALSLVCLIGTIIYLKKKGRTN